MKSFPFLLCRLVHTTSAQFKNPPKFNFKGKKKDSGKSQQFTDEGKVGKAIFIKKKNPELVCIQVENVYPHLPAGVDRCNEF